MCVNLPENQYAPIADMETGAGLTDPIKPLITSHSALKIAMHAIADTTFLTILQKRENRFHRLSLLIT